MQNAVSADLHSNRITLVNQSIANSQESNALVDDDEELDRYYKRHEPEASQRPPLQPSSLQASSQGKQSRIRTLSPGTLHRNVTKSLRNDRIGARTDRRRSQSPRNARYSTGDHAASPQNDHARSSLPHNTLYADHNASPSSRNMTDQIPIGHLEITSMIEQSPISYLEISYLEISALIDNDIIKLQ
jgi:hypothetical protein